MTATSYTRYERARIVGARALQISMGAPVLVRTAKIDPLDIALVEFDENRVPITVRRQFGNVVEDL
ncbi:MAG TPA: DNA-directed RNA polymerase subunit K [Methanocorpusculum sp.]|nr:DNA-directed RNA polymerase subunit K [Methanocorpusculum parvum]MBQ1179742.1 DNA-directed RNA polymerase subunit K [Methanocorpusculum sp.]MBQ2771601.1 DNA-directed RNA polymerase subunit K [Methanocorpusculum sp.]MBQ4134357.1 DNA-directed RNA polymerase subunit K [Methanocorpusculum sp.]MBQ4597407.1 DNA-directed RNA polymerase subunit K [Methanocorpusculum sp.]